ncbi:MAG TPA: hypothetical protein VIX37_10105, partial [Candidatus Sulfotelmatobacter sp.]
MRPGTRATRVSLQGRISAILQLENGRQLSGTLYQLSVTGGLLEIAMYLDERTKVGLAIPIGGNVLRPDAEMLFPMWGADGFLQPFRFTRLWAQERQVLEAEIAELLQQSVTRSTLGRGIGARPRSFYLGSFE